MRSRVSEPAVLEPDFFLLKALLLARLEHLVQPPELLSDKCIRLFLEGGVDFALNPNMPDDQLAEMGERQGNSNLSLEETEDFRIHQRWITKAKWIAGESVIDSSDWRVLCPEVGRWALHFVLLNEFSKMSLHVHIESGFVHY